MEAEVAKGNAGAKLAFTRITFNYFISETVCDYILDAVHLIADEGWKLLPLYRFDPVTGLWHHRAAAPEELPSLRAVLTGGGGRPSSAPESVLPGQLQAAWRIIAAVQGRPPAGPLDDPELTDDFERIRWFPLPSEGLARLRAANTRSLTGGSHGT
jgi:hypothetical protein